MLASHHDVVMLAYNWGYAVIPVFFVFSLGICSNSLTGLAVQATLEMPGQLFQSDGLPVDARVSENYGQRFGAMNTLTSVPC